MPVWAQAYMKKINAGAKEQEAIDFADMVILDVRPASMYEQAHIQGAINIPAAQIRNRLGEPSHSL